MKLYTACSVYGVLLAGDSLKTLTGWIDAVRKILDDEDAEFGFLDVNQKMQRIIDSIDGERIDRLIADMRVPHDVELYWTGTGDNLEPGSDVAADQWVVGYAMHDFPLPEPKNWGTHAPQWYTWILSTEAPDAD